tara:strand:- start:1887 stop:2792 length:906 start_codon:yes stop_codon:yes gene_type:complete
LISVRLNACIVIISSRDKCIQYCIKSLWDNYNYKYNYPVFVHYFDDIYDSKYFQEKIKSITSQNIYFISIDYKTPDFITESELFYNRHDIWYVRKSFPKERKGYLHMCNFTSNMYGYENTHLHEFDFIMTHDDEAGYNKELNFDPFRIIYEKKIDVGAYFVGQRLKSGRPHQGHIDTRIGLWDFTKKFIIENHVTPKSAQLNNLLNDKNAHENFHYIDWCDTYVINTSIFKTNLWKKWINAVNENGGIYKFRWGDNEIISLFVHMHQREIYNLNLVSNGYHNQSMFRKYQNYAPGVKNLKK